MSFSMRLAFVAITVFAAMSVSTAQSLASSAAPAAPDSTSITYSSSSVGLDLETSTENLNAVGASPAAANGVVRNGRPAYAASRSRLFTEKGVGTFISPLGIGVGAATTLSRSFNLRAAGNFFGYSLSGINSDVKYQGTLTFRSVQASVDWFPWHRSFHLSPGVLFYNQNHVTVQGGVAAGQSFTVNGATYYSSASDPVTLYGNVIFHRTSPMFTAGWGNWLPRRPENHFSFPFDIGFAYVGEPPLALNFTGVVCDTPADVNCRMIDSDPTVQDNINAQRKKYQNDLYYVRFYPILSTGVTYKF